MSASSKTLWQALGSHVGQILETPSPGLPWLTTAKTTTQVKLIGKDFTTVLPTHSLVSLLISAGSPSAVS